MRLRNLPPRRDTRDAQDVYPLPPALLRSLFQKPLPGAVAITLHGSGWKIPHATRVTHEKAPSGNGVSGIPRLLCPRSVLALRYNGCGVRVKETSEASSVRKARHASREGFLMRKDLWMSDSPDALDGEVKRSLARVGHLVIGRSL